MITHFLEGKDSRVADTVAILFDENIDHEVVKVAVGTEVEVSDSTGKTAIYEKYPNQESIFWLVRKDFKPTWDEEFKPIDTNG